MTVQISVIDDSHHYRWYHWRKKNNRKILNFLQDTIKSDIHDFGSGNEISDSYPWCFVFSAKHLCREHYYIGALTISKNNCNKDDLCVIFSRLPYDKISEEFRKKFHVAFWQARILATRHCQWNDNKKTFTFRSGLKPYRYITRHFGSLFSFVETTDSVIYQSHCYRTVTF